MPAHTSIRSRYKNVSEKSQHNPCRYCADKKTCIRHCELVSKENYARMKQGAYAF